MSLLDIAQARKGKARDSVGKAKAGVSQAGTRVEYGTATAASADGYVEIIMDNGGSAFTVPCDSVINQGDRVSYISHAGQGKAVSLYGTTAAIEANAALAQQAYDNADDAAQAASDAAQAASDASDEAQAAMDAIDQHFWTDTDGVHVTQGSVKDETITGKNILINTLGVIFRNALAYLAQFTASGVTFFDGSGTSADHQTAQFTSTTARVGMLSQKHVTMNSNGVSIADGDYTQAMFNGGSIAFYDGLGNAASNITAQFGADGARIGYQASDNVIVYPGGMEVNTNGLMSCEIAKSSDSLAGMVSRERFAYTSPGPLSYIFNGSPLNGSKVGFVYGGEIVIIFLQGRASTQTLSSAYGGITVAYDGNNMITVSGGSLTSAAVGVNYLMATAVDAPYFTFGTSTDEGSDRGAISFTSGIGLTARNRFQAVIGKYNVNVDRPLVIGGGTSDSDRKNLFSVDWSGNARLPGFIAPWASNLTSNTAVDAQTTGSGRYYLADSAGTVLGGLAPRFDAKGSDGTSVQVAQFYAQRVANGSTIFNTLSLGIDASGGRTVAFSSATPWRTALHIGSVTWVRTANLALTAGNDTKVTLNGSSTATPPGYINSNSSLFGYTSGGIQCKVAGYVKVSAAVFAENLTAGNGGLAIWVQNGTTVLRELSVPIPSTQGFGTAVFPEYTVQVAANDVLYLYARATYAGRIAANKAWMTVEYVG